MRLREVLSRLWLEIAKLAPQPEDTSGITGGNERLQQMLAHIYEHYSERLSVSDLAQAAFISPRECYRLFDTYLHCPPTQYMIRYRLQMAMYKLARGDESITDIAHACGFGTSSYFGKMFLEHFHCTPKEYRRRWQDYDKT